MGTKKVDKNCKQCGILMENVDASKLLCEDCNKQNRKLSYSKHRNKQRKKEIENNALLYKDNFIKVVSFPFHLTSTGFNQVSNLKVKSYCQVYDCTWIDIIKHFNKYDELYNYIKNEYIDFYNNTGKQNMRLFCKQHKYIIYEVVYQIGIDKIMNDCGIKKQISYSEDDYKNNFEDIVINLGRVPLYNEFEEFSNISLTSYTNKFNLKGKIYNQVVKLFATSEQYNEYMKLRLIHKSEVGRLYNKSEIKISNEELENEFYLIFNQCKDNFNTYPTKRYFNKLSKYDDSLYRKRYNLKWAEICEMFGYKLEDKNPSETIVVKSIQSILNTELIRHKTFDWLRGINNGKMHVDGFYPEYNLAIEFDGRQHRKSVESFGGEERFKILQQNDNIKNILLHQHNIILIRIDSRFPWHNIEYLKKVLYENNILSNIA